MSEHMGTTGPLGAPEPGFFLHKREAWRPGVETMVNDQNDAAFELSQKIADAFGIRNINTYESQFSLFNEVTRIPAADVQTTREEVRSQIEEAVDRGLISGYVRAQFLRSIDQLFARKAWIDDLKAEIAEKNPKDDREYARICFELLAGEPPRGSNVKIILTPISVHVISREFTNEALLLTSAERSTYENGVPTHLRPLDRDTINAAMEAGHYGHAGRDVRRPGPGHTVTTGKIPFNSLNPSLDTKQAFDTFRHEFDHQIYALYHEILDQEDKHDIFRLNSKSLRLAREYTARAAERAPQEEMDVRIEELQEVLTILWSYLLRPTQATANEFLSQYGDGGAKHAQESLDEPVYIQHHLRDKNGVDCKAWCEDRAAQIDKSDEKRIRAHMRMHPYDYGARIRDLRNAWISNGVQACEMLEGLGLQRNDIAARLRFIPFNQWIAFARRERDRRTNTTGTAR